MGAISTSSTRRFFARPSSVFWRFRAVCKALGIEHNALLELAGHLDGRTLDGAGARETIIQACEIIGVSARLQYTFHETRGHWRLAVAVGALIGALVLPCCEDRPSAPTTNAGESSVLRLQTQHFRLFGDRVTDAVLRDVADNLEANFQSGVADLSVGSVEPVAA